METFVCDRRYDDVAILAVKLNAWQRTRNVLLVTMSRIQSPIHLPVENV
jgi:hypothetical protein